MRLLALSLAALLSATSLAADINSLPDPDTAAPRRPMNVAQFHSELRKLGVVGRALYLGAHPDDENTAMLSWLENQMNVRAAYLSLTRGDGGQNLLGTEKGSMLGLIRLQELLAARRVDGAEQFFTRAMDFGYSKSPEETFSIWNHDAVLSDVVWVIRLFKPDVIITRFPKTGEGGHGQHTASAILAEEAFAAAADPSRFPEQLAWVKPWQTKRIFWNVFRPQLENRPAGAPRMISVDLGTYDALHGMAHSEVAGLSRSMHKSQGDGTPQRRGSILNYLEQLGGDAVEKDPFENLDLSWNRIAGGAKAAAIVNRIGSSCTGDCVSSSIPDLVALLREIDAIRPADAWTADMLAEKRHAVTDLITSAAGLWVEALAPAHSVTPGENVKITTTVINRSNATARLVDLNVGGTVIAVGAPLENNKPLAREQVVTIGPGLSQPYWLRAEPQDALYPAGSERERGRPEGPAPLSVRARIEIGGAPVEVETPVFYKWTDRVAGDSWRLVRVVPPVTVTVASAASLVSGNGPKAITATVRSATDHQGTISVAAPAGWDVADANYSVTASRPVADVTLTLKPLSAARTATASLRVDGRDAYGLATINYPHIPIQSVLVPAATKLVRTAVSTRGSAVGYVEGAGDDIPAALEQMGYAVTTLSDADIESGDLSKFDTIVTGVRAYNTRDILKRRQDRLDQYVSNGGTLVVQYSTPDETLAKRLAPYPLELSRDRVTREDAEVRFVDAGHPLINKPNRITTEDFSGWVQERGLWFAGKWDPAFKPVLASNDPGEQSKEGGLLVARHGRGAYVYTGYAFFRQLPAGVPGAYRLFANIVSLRGTDLPEVAK